MRANNKDSQFSRALELTALCAMAIFVVLFMIAFLGLIDVFKSELYTNAVAGLSLR